MNIQIIAAALDGLAAKLDSIGKDEEVIKRALFDGAGILADQVRSNLEGVLSGKGTGELESSLGISDMRVNRGIADVAIGFQGYDSKGTPNALKARVLESGTSENPGRKKPFMRPAINSTKAAVQQKMVETLTEEVDKKLR